MRTLRREEVERKTGLSRSAIYALMAADRFPKPVQLIGRAVGWVEAEVEEWLKN